MKRREYFLKALRAQAFVRKVWVITNFAVVRYEGKRAQEMYPYKIVYKEDNDKDTFFYDPDLNDLVQIEGVVRGKPLFNVLDVIELEPGDLPNVKHKLTTVYGNVLINAMVYCWAFGDKIPFIMGRTRGKETEVAIADRLIDDPEDGVFPPTDRIYVSEYLKYCEAVSALEGFTTICVPAASPKTMTVNPAILKRKEELLEEYKDQLHDKAIVARIQTELSNMEREDFKGDPGEGFYLKPKSYDVSRMKAHIMHGTESGFGDSKEGNATITTPLSEGWDTTKFPPMFNSLRAGSFFRGNQTALAGQMVKELYRVFQNTVVIVEDCGTKSGIIKRVTKRNLEELVGLYEKGSGKVALTREALADKVGSVIFVRSPMVCKVAAPSYCMKCAGTMWSGSSTALSSSSPEMAGVILNMFMSRHHGVALRTAEYNFRESIT